MAHWRLAQCQVSPTKALADMGQSRSVIYHNDMRIPNLLVIFGAGASHDSLRDSDTRVDPWRPPLTRDLYSGAHGDLLGMFPGSARIVELLALRPDEQNLETRLRELADESSKRAERAGQILMFQFYLRELFAKCSEWANDNGGHTNYARIVDELDAWRQQAGWTLSLLTFNYDTLVDRAMESALGNRLTSLDQYLLPHVQLFKPHGSVNWIRSVPGFAAGLPDQSPATAVAELRQSSPHWRASKRFEIASTNAVFDSRGELAVPALSLPLDEKSEYSFPDPHRDAMHHAIRRATGIITIGWRATELHFLRELGGALRDGIAVHVLTRSERTASEAIYRLREVYPTGDYSPHGGSFSDTATSGSWLRAALDGLRNAPIPPQRR